MIHEKLMFGNQDRGAIVERGFLKLQRDSVGGSPMVRSVKRGNADSQAFLLLSDGEKDLTGEEINELQIIL